MASKKFMDALNLLIEEKGIEKDVFLEMLKESIGKAYKKNYLNSDANVRVEINEKTGKFRLFELRTVVDDLEDEDLYDLNDASEKLGYITEQMTDIQSLNVINIFALGVLAGLVMGFIMWRVVND